LHKRGVAEKASGGSAFPDLGALEFGVQEAREFRPIRARGFLDDYAFASRLARLFELEFRVLIEGR